MAAPLALPRAFRDRAPVRSSLVVGAYAYGTAAVLVAGSLVGVYTTFRAGDAGRFPPTGSIKLNYMASCLLALSFMMSITAEWVVWAVRRTERRQAASAALLTGVFLLAAINGVLYLTRQVGVSASSGGYGTMFFAFITLDVLAYAAAVVSMGVLGFKVGGRQVTATEPEGARAAAIAVHVASLVWIITWAVIYAGSK